MVHIENGRWALWLVTFFLASSHNKYVNPHSILKSSVSLPLMSVRWVSRRTLAGQGVGGVSGSRGEEEIIQELFPHFFVQLPGNLQVPEADVQHFPTLN